jgi:hypothetical protein
MKMMVVDEDHHARQGREPYGGCWSRLRSAKAPLSSRGGRRCGVGTRG